MIATLEDDPCQRFRDLNQIRDDIITGGKASEVDHENGNGVKRRVRFTQANLSALEREISKAKEACDIKEGRKGARGRGMIAGSRGR